MSKKERFWQCSRFVQCASSGVYKTLLYQVDFQLLLKFDELHLRYYIASLVL